MKCAETLRDELPLAKPFDAHRERGTTDPAPDFSRTLVTAAMYRLSRCVPLAHEDKTFQDAHHPAIKARQRVPLSRTNLLHQVRHLMAPQLRASSIELVV